MQHLIVFALSATLLLYGVLIYFCLKFPERFFGGVSSVLALNQKSIKYEKTGLSEAFSQELKDKLENVMSEEKLYLNHELRLGDIADLLNISRHHASQVINENFNMSFYDYVNSYRIEEAKSKLGSSFENTSTSISDVAYQCGFNNRVSFYKAFKKITRITPKEFIQKAA
ncbi:helix-turn-helix domain-containing protein [Flagellimonas crocea]|uniref:helix-turn-helix domain-containing protein n=1 Tax=Flagellimonas crocea TaxID=3067311 RepID=UPI00296FB9CD|nr:helix-turn-helix transcriptional regulator [Muricauda sp. DH64]